VILEQIQSPADLRRLNPAQLEVLAREIRNFLVDAVSRTGGHLGPNLGVVELTIALHRVLDSPHDRIIFDCGHQAYVHKLLTGRREAFATLRQAGGLSGYPCRAESPHDLVENSHASTSLSYALGLTETRKPGDGGVVVVIGDGALTGGMAYEALNAIGSRKPDLLIVLNDNGRSYAPTVGGLARHLASLRLDPRYHAAKQDVSDALSSVPGVGRPLASAAKRAKASLKELLAPQVWFEHLGISYTGPIDGHDIQALETALIRVRQIRGPVVLHVVTEKGRGYPPAENDETDRYHGVGTFDPRTGRVNRPSDGVSFTNVFGEALLREAKEHPDLVAVTAAMGAPVGLAQMTAVFPERVFDAGIAEQHAVTLAAGLAMGGKRPVVAVYSSFLQRAFDQVLMDVCLHNLPVILVLDRSGITGEDGPSHHGAFDLSYLRMMPNLVVASPRDASELRRLLATAIARTDGPMAIRFPKGTTNAPPDTPSAPVPIGSWEVLREGSGVLVLAVGRCVGEAMAASQRLAGRKGERMAIDPMIVDARFVKPLDPRLAQMAAEHRAVVTVEDNVLTGGFGSAVLEALSAAGVQVPVSRLGLPDRFLPHGAPTMLLNKYGLSASGIAKAIETAAEKLGDTELPYSPKRSS